MATNLRELDQALARLDMVRAKRIGSMLVTQEPAERFDEDPDEMVIDITKLDGRELCEGFEREDACFDTTPLDPTGSQFRLYPGGVTIWSGFPGAGKTTILRQIICHLLHAGKGVFLASLEEHPRHALYRLAGTAAGREKPTAHQMQWFIDAYGERFRLWGHVGMARHRRILAAIRKAAEEGIKHAFLDSLMCLDVANDKTEEQRCFANLLANTARASGLHLHLVAHPRKLISSEQEPDINDVAGAREIGGIADNVVFIRRSKNESDVSKDRRAMLVSIRKQRHGTGDLGEIKGWFHREMRQFHLEQFPSGPARYLPPDAYT